MNDGINIYESSGKEKILIIHTNNGPIYFHREGPKDCVIFLRIEHRRENSYFLSLFIKTSVTEKTIVDQLLVDIPQKFFHKLYRFEKSHLQGAKNLRGVIHDFQEPIELVNILGKSIYKTFFIDEINNALEEYHSLLSKQKIDSLNLVISSEHANILNIPFETMRPKFLLKKGIETPISLINRSFLLSRTQESTLSEYSKSGSPEIGPLRILFISSLPETIPGSTKFIELEKEIQKLVLAIGSLLIDKKVLVEFLDIASIENIHQAIEKGQHHIVHISGLGSFNNKVGTLFLENSAGGEHKVSLSELEELGIFLNKNGVKMVFLSACETARADDEGVAGIFIRKNIPAVLAMRYPVTDPTAIKFTTTFYQHLCDGKDLSTAIFHARNSIRKEEKGKKENSLIDNWPTPEWFTPIIYLNQNIKSIVSYKDQDQERYLSHFSRRQKSILVDGLQIQQGFVGRKRQLAQLNSFFKSGIKAICIHGLGGLGKTALATRFATNFQNGTYRVIQFFGRINKTSLIDRLLIDAENTLEKEQDLKRLKSEIQQNQNNAKANLSILIRGYLEYQNLKVILLFDNFEENQSIEKKSPNQIRDYELEELLKFLIENIPRNCFILFTTRYVLQNLPLTPLEVDEMTLSEIFRLLALDDELIVRLKLEEIRSIKKELGGHPFAIGLVKSYLKENPTANWIDLKTSLTEIGTDVNEKRNLLLQYLWELLSFEEQEILKVASVFQTDFPSSAIENLSEFDMNTIQTSLDRLNKLSLCFKGKDNQFYVHRLVARFLKSIHISTDSLKSIHNRVAQYLLNVKKSSPKDFMESLWHFKHARNWEEFVSLTFRLENAFRAIGEYGFAKYLMENFLKEELANKNELKNKARAHYHLGMILFHIGIFEEESQEHFKLGLEIYEGLNEKVGYAKCLIGQGKIFSQLGNYDEAQESFESALTIFKQELDLFGMVNSWIERTTLFILQKNYNLALVHGEISEKIILEASVTGLFKLEKEKVDSYHCMGRIYINNGDIDKAIYYVTEARKVLEKHPDKKQLGINFYLMGVCLKEEKIFDDASLKLETSRKIMRKIGCFLGILQALIQLGILEYQRSNYKNTLKYLCYPTYFYYKNKRPEGNIIDYYLQNIKDEIGEKVYEKMFVEAIESVIDPLDPFLRD